MYTIHTPNAPAYTLYAPLYNLFTHNPPSGVASVIAASPHTSTRVLSLVVLAVPAPATSLVHSFLNIPVQTLNR